MQPLRKKRNTFLQDLKYTPPLDGADQRLNCVSLGCLMHIELQHTLKQQSARVGSILPVEKWLGNKLQSARRDDVHALLSNLSLQCFNLLPYWSY